MKLSEVAAVASNLNSLRLYHIKQRSYFLNLFNALVPADKPSGPIVLHDYTLLMEFYQAQCQHHAAEVFKTDAAMQVFCELSQAEFDKNGAHAK